jgi:hypothetical protein
MNNNYLHAGLYQNKYSEQENRQFTVKFGAITQKMAAALGAGEAFDSEAMQQVVKEHYEFCLRFWTPNREAYKSLAMSFILPTEYRDSYESVSPGLGKYVYDAITHFADTNLS